MSLIQRFAAALVDVAAFVFTLGLIDHITGGYCRHCKR